MCESSDVTLRLYAADALTMLIRVILNRNQEADKKEINVISCLLQGDLVVCFLLGATSVTDTATVGHVIQSTHRCATETIRVCSTGKCCFKP